ncbi:hypothetical protein MGQ_01759 [Candida albicans P76067]|nr:hypothetical protein MGQ_01759 [Candida albicans P76067]
MLRRTISRQFQRSQSTSTKGFWSDFSKRSPSLRIQNENIRKGLFEGIDEQGPASIKNSNIREIYHSPIAIDETFSEAYKILEADASKKYGRLEKLQEEYTKIEDKSSTKANSIKREIEELQIETELRNPEVLYNIEYNSADVIDKSQLIYRKLLKEKWKEHDLLLTMQRLEQLHVIPDTLPTLVPEADVKVKFSHNVEHEFRDWIAPGSILPTFAVEKPPVVQVQEFDKVEGNERLYTVLLVNPDTPDLEKNSFSTTLHYALANVSLNNIDNTIDVSKLLNEGDKIVLKDYLPLTPEKNTPAQRACLWVFRQKNELQPTEITRENFDIRSFVESNNLSPIGAHVWRQQFDRSVNEIREKYGLDKGRVFYKERGLAPMP